MDYRQLEIRVLALATACPQLIDDINHDIDLHKYFAAQIYNKMESAVTDAERKLAKGFSFQLQYGAGPVSISKHWGVEVELVKTFIAAYYERYPEVKTWQDENIAKCEANKFNAGTRRTVYNRAGESTDTDDNVHTTYVPNIWGMTGAIGSFCLDGTSRVNWQGQLEEKFSPTQIKNYPIQGGAADIVLLMLTKLSRLDLICRDTNFLFVNTVHDSFLFDCDLARVENLKCIQKAKDCLESVPEVLFEVFGMHSPVEFPVDVTRGHRWNDRTEMKIEYNT
jgi:DNA polymerase I-like protein with 3'-5' exonuclease and polymerase domains